MNVRGQQSRRSIDGAVAKYGATNGEHRIAIRQIARHTLSARSSGAGAGSQNRRRARDQDNAKSHWNCSRGSEQNASIRLR
jgi:hypothetical protein